VGIDPDRPTGTIVVLVDGGNRAMFTDRGANAALGAGDLPASLLDDAALLHVSGYALFAPGPRAAALALMDAASARGVPISVDCASASFLRDAPEFAEWIRPATVCFANEEEAAVLRPLDHPIVAIKRGAAGATIRQRGQTPMSLPASPATLVDPTGAGDAFCAGFLARWVAGEDLEACARAALETAAAALAQPGGRPTRPPG
jgi:sugar/nucleoside kinase (ribokinase family)